MRMASCLILFALTLIFAFQAESNETWRGLVVAPEHRCSTYASSDYSYPQSVEPLIVEAMGGRIYGPYTGTCFSSIREADIEHIVARSEAHDSGLCSADAETKRNFARDLLNLTLASPSVNRHQKSDKDAAEWLPEMNSCWFAERVVQVRLKYGLTIDRSEADALERVLSACESTAMVFTECPSGPMLTSTEYVIPTAVNAPGRFGAYYKTRVVMHNMSDVGYSITTSLFGPNGPVSEKSIAIEANQYQWWDNFLEEVFNYRGAGAVVFMRDENGDSKGGDPFETSFALTADVYTDSENGRYSTTVINGTSVAASAHGDEAFNSGISVNENQRTNLGAFNFGESPYSIQARIFDRFGTLAQTIRFEMNPYSWSQKSISAPIDNGIIRWELPEGNTDSSDERVYLWAVMVDNRSNDGTLTWAASPNSER